MERTGEGFVEMGQAGHEPERRPGRQVPYPSDKPLSPWEKHVREVEMGTVLT